MKKIISFTIVLTLVISLSVGCTSTSKSEMEEFPQLAPSSSVPQENFSSNLTTSKDEGIDFDLAALSDTMVYAQLYTILMSPEEYNGKVIRIKGTFDSQKDEETGEDIFGILVCDSTACCFLGLEFDLAGDYSYPDDYPSIDSEITITGTFELYTHNDALYAKLNNSILE